MKKRLDVLLVERGLAQSRAQAQALVLAGRVPGYEKAGQQVDESAELSAGLKLQLHARRLVLAHPSRGTLVLEAPLSPEMRAGFERFGFDEHEADPEPFGRSRR